MTHEHDHIVILFEGGSRRLFCNKNNISWPPPEEMELGGFKLKQTRRSQITDEQIKDMTHLARGAEYEVVS